jgi:pimeloyl-ACP methyl ester carboxylesterase
MKPSTLAIVVSIFLGLSTSAHPREHHRRPIVIEQQGSFFVGGRTITAPGQYDPTIDTMTDVGQSFQVDHLYASFQIPVHHRSLPLVFIHGGGAGVVWGSTPDGREGFQTLFLRRAFPVYVVDFPRRGRAGLPSFNGPLGRLLDDQLFPGATTKTSNEKMFLQFRLGPAFLEYFPNSQFPRSGLAQYLSTSIAQVTDEDGEVTDSLVGLLDRIGPAILVAHSQSGRFSCLTAIRTPNVRAIVSFEGVLNPFPIGEVPPAIPRYDGLLIGPGQPVSAADFEKLTKLPIHFIEGDNIPVEPTPILPLDIQRIRAVHRQQFIETVNRHGGDASILRLPDVGVYGNTHFSFLDLNNVEIADLMSQFLHEKGLDQRVH